MNKNVLLIYPPKKIHKTNSAPAMIGDISLALLYLAAAARPVCDTVRLYDMNLEKNTIEKLVEIISIQPPSVIAINCLFSAVFPSVRKLAKYVKSIAPEIKIVIGGMHPTIFAKEIANKCPEINAVMLGEGDLSFPKLLQYFWNELPQTELDSVVLRIDDRVISYPKQSYVQDLDTLPMPAYDLINFDDYKQNVSGWYNPKGIKINPKLIPILTSRSCPNQCSFCAMRLVMGDRIRVRSAESVLNEIKYLYEHYGINYFKVMDDNFTFDHERAKKILHGILEDGLNIYLDFSNGLMIRTLDEELIELFAQVGTPILRLAVESGSDYIRNTIMHKHVSTQKIYEILELCKKQKIISHLFFLIGMPEETHETLNETLEFINNVDFNSFTISLIRPYPGTGIFEQAKQDRLFTNNIGNIDDMWNGEFFCEGEDGFIKQSIYIEPYALKYDELLLWYGRLERILEEKCKVWIEHKKQSTGLLD